VLIGQLCRSADMPCSVGCLSLPCRHQGCAPQVGVRHQGNLRAGRRQDQDCGRCRQAQGSISPALCCCCCCGVCLTYVTLLISRAGCTTGPRWDDGKLSESINYARFAVEPVAGQAYAAMTHCAKGHRVSSGVDVMMVIWPIQLAAASCNCESRSPADARHFQWVMLQRFNKPEA